MLNISITHVRDREIEIVRANKDWLIGVPEKVSKLNAQAEENEYEHKEFKMRLGVLERSV
jgi:hypothetical protein